MNGSDWSQAQVNIDMKERIVTVFLIADHHKCSIILKNSVLLWEFALNILRRMPVPMTLSPKQGPSKESHSKDN